MNIEVMEWQLLSDNDWVFGLKIRGIVRVYHAEVWFDEEGMGGAGGWYWIARIDRRIARRGKAPSLSAAINMAEDALTPDGHETTKMEQA